MSKINKPNNPQTAAAQTPKSGNSLEKYFGSPVDSTKKRKMSSLDLSGNSSSPPAKKLDKMKPPPPMVTKRDKKETTTPTSDTAGMQTLRQPNFRHGKKTRNLTISQSLCFHNGQCDCRSKRANRLFFKRSIGNNV